MPSRGGTKKPAVDPTALAMPMSMPAKRGAMSRWLMRKPLYWKPQKARPMVLKDMVARHLLQSMNPIAAIILAGTMAPVSES